MLVFLCCFLRPARGCRPLRLQIYQKNPGFETKPRSFFSKPIPREKPTAGPSKAAAQADRLPFPCLHAVGLKPDISSGTCSHLRKCKNLAYRQYTRFLHVCPPSQGFMSGKRKLNLSSLSVMYQYDTANFRFSGH